MDFSSDLAGIMIFVSPGLLSASPGIVHLSDLVLHWRNGLGEGGKGDGQSSIV